MKLGSDDFTPTAVPVAARPDSREIAGAGGRRASDVPVAEPWRETLLRLSVELPIDVGLEPVARAVVDRLSPVLPTLAIGACVVTSSEQRPIVVARLPPGLVPDQDRDPTRLFPRLAEEHIVDLADGASGSTFHVACPDGVGQLTPFHLQVAERAALVLGAAIGRARRYQLACLSGERVEELKSQVIQAEKLASLGQIVAGVVHELNNPLTSILAYAEHLGRRLANKPEAREDLERVRRIAEAADRILKFSRDLVAYARPSSENPGMVRLQEVVDKALIFCEHEFSSEGIQIERAFSGDLPLLNALPGQLTQVFVNLFTNAAHSMAAGGGVLRISAALDASTKTLIVDVSDTGRGIPPEDLPQIFEPFFTTKTDGQGTGLGLSIVREIMDSHGGTITVRSAIDGGTTFTLALPLAGDSGVTGSSG